MPRPPRLSGAPLKSLARVGRTRAFAIAFDKIMRADLGIDRLARLPDNARLDVPLDTRPHPGRPPRQWHSENLPAATHAWAPTSVSLTTAYREGRLSPHEVVEKVLAEARRLAKLTPTVGPIYDFADEAAFAEADASEARWREGRPLGPLDGVPWVVKEQAAVRGLPRRFGTGFMPATPEPHDSAAVARARAVGAITLGTTPMTEYGMTPNGANANRAMPHNPHAPGHFAGGSSTGSGVAVATGLVPFALGADGGGSIRIPSALNGIFGMKPTWGRVSRSGDIATGTVSHVGPLAGSVLDLAFALETISGYDGDDPQTLAAPQRAPGSFVEAVGRGVRGLVIGVVESEWAHATPAVVRAGKAALDALEKEGAKLVPIRLALAEYAMAIGVVTIGLEARALLRAEWLEHRDEMSADLQVTFASLDGFSAVEYLDACRIRSGMRREMAGAFQSVDLVALPSTVAPAAKVSEGDMRTGFLDTSVIEGLCRFAFLANLTGLPALSAPVGISDNGLPVGLQLVGDAWDEATVLSAAAHLERIGAAMVRRPRVTATII
ncbi:MAG: amidase [Polyangiaceae bacterium]|nr:amidase [Polyangiaceae bacterium]